MDTNEFTRECLVQTPDTKLRRNWFRMSKMMHADVTLSIHSMLIVKRTHDNQNRDK